MYVTKIKIENVRSIESLEIELAEGDCPGWHVILGANGAGKSTVIRSIALALVGPKEALALRQPWDIWQRQNASSGCIRLRVHPTVDGGRILEQKDLAVGVQFHQTSGSGFGMGPFGNGSFGGGPRVDIEETPDTDPQASSIVWAATGGWFSASFGPFRRFSGGDQAFERLYQSNPRLAPHLSAFGEDVALTEGLRWLQTLRVRSLESADGAAQLLKRLIHFLNRSELLPHGAELADVRSERVTITDAGGAHVSVEQMSDGYRSVLSMIFEIIRQMTAVYGAETVSGSIDVDAGCVNLPGVVSIDEVDAHLHPSWQRDIGPWFTRCFPRLQFFVTTHSPIICREAKSVWRLPAPGSDEAFERVEGTVLKRLIYGSILDAYGTGIFGDDVVRSDESKRKLAELAALNRKALQVTLNPEESAQLQELQAALPTRASDTAAE